MATIKSTFNRNTDGWTIAGDAQIFEWLPDGGDKDGHLHWVDAASGDGAFWRAPTKFLGDLSGFFRGKLSFSWYASGNDLPGSDVLVTGANGHTLIGDVGAPELDWTRESIRFAGGQWRLDSPDGAFATTREIKAVLADVTQILIRAEHVYGGESGGLDKVVLASKAEVPEGAFGVDQHPVVRGGYAEAHPQLDASHLALA